MRAIRLLPGALYLALAVGAAAQSAPALSPPSTGNSAVLRGTAALILPGGVSLAGTVSIEVAGPSYCKVALNLGPPGRPITVTAVLNGNRSVAAAPARLLRQIPLPVSPALGCALVPGALNAQRLALVGAALSLSPSGEPAQLTLTLNGAPATVAYADIQAAGDTAYAATVSARAGGATLALQLTSATQAPFAAADFAVPPLHAPATHGYGGGQ